MDTPTRSASTPNLLAVVAEDELLLQALVREVLKQEGFHVETFGTADAALHSSSCTGSRSMWWCRTCGCRA